MKKINNETLELQSLIIKDLVKTNVRKHLEKSVDERGLPVFVPFEIEDKNGILIEVYKRESLFDGEDYKKAAEYQTKLAAEHKELADYYSAGAENESKYISRAVGSSRVFTLYPNILEDADGEQKQNESKSQTG